MFQGLILPIIYVYFGQKLPNFLFLNVELASRHNKVIIISNFKDNKHISDQYRRQNRSVIFENLDDYTSSSNEFSSVYVHLTKSDYTDWRIFYEKICFQRWFILKEYMEKRNITRCLSGDHDSIIFVNISQINNFHAKCDAVINVEGQSKKMLWTGAGEAALWSLPALQDFCRFTTALYTSHLHVLKLKGGKGRGDLTDMGVLYVWWVANHDTPGWESGRPWLHREKNRGQSALRAYQTAADESFWFLKRQNLPSTYKSMDSNKKNGHHRLKLCNGLSVVNRTVFDHRAAWEWIDGFTLNLNGSGVPYGFGESLRIGGAPESTDPKTVQLLHGERLYFNNVHYQSDAKVHIPYDVCRVLAMTGDRKIIGLHAQKVCSVELDKRRPDFACVPHGKLAKRTSGDGVLSFLSPLLSSNAPADTGPCV